MRKKLIPLFAALAFAAAAAPAGAGGGAMIKPSRVTSCDYYACLLNCQMKFSDPSACPYICQNDVCRK